MIVIENVETDEHLLERVRDPHDRDAWYEFASIYRPLLYRVGRRSGLQDADVQNLVQDVFQKVLRQLNDPHSGRPAHGFRRWLAVVARNTAIDAVRRIRPDAARGGTSVQLQLQEVRTPEDSSAAEHQLQLELERQAFRWAAARIRDDFTEDTWTAFWETMVEGRTCSRVADSLGKSIGAIYTARSRVMNRLKEEVKQFNWQPGD